MFWAGETRDNIWSTSVMLSALNNPLRLFPLELFTREFNIRELLEIETIPNWIRKEAKQKWAGRQVKPEKSSNEGNA